VFTYGAPQLKFGPGASAEIGYDLSQLGARRVLVVTDPGVAATGHPARIAGQLAGLGLDARVYDGVHVEPTDQSLAAAAEYARASGYPIAGRARDFRPPDYPGTGPLVPHGMWVALTAPEAFRFTFPAAPDRHLRAAALLAPGADPPADPARALPAALLRLMRDVGLPAGVAAVGFTEADVPALVADALQQQRLLATCPRPVTADDLAGIFSRSMELW
jgi:alcohol dehydrogenase class IV